MAINDKSNIRGFGYASQVLNITKIKKITLNRWLSEYLIIV